MECVVKTVAYLLSCTARTRMPIAPLQQYLGLFLLHTQTRNYNISIIVYQLPPRIGVYRLDRNRELFPIFLFKFYYPMTRNGEKLFCLQSFKLTFCGRGLRDTAPCFDHVVRVIRSLLLAVVLLRLLTVPVLTGQGTNHCKFLSFSLLICFFCHHYSNILSVYFKINISIGL